MIRNPVLDEVRSSIHSKPIPWNGLVRANVVDESEVQSFESLGKLSSQERHHKVADESQKYAELVAQLLLKDIRDDIVKYLVLFMVEYGDDIPSFATALAKQAPIYEALSQRFSRKDSQIATLSAVALSILATSGVQAPAASVEATFNYIVTNLFKNAKNDIHLKDLGAQLIARLVQDNTYRSQFSKFADSAVPSLNELVSTGPLQVQYTSLITLWILSFDKVEAVKFLTEFNVVKTVIETCRQAIREKIVRVGIAVLSNLLRFAPKTAVPVLIAEDALPACKLIAQRKWTDEELVADLDYLTSTLTTEFHNMTTFEEYSGELKSKNLRWSHVHTNQGFWTENIDEFSKNNWDVLKQLIALLNSSNEVTVAVAAHDIAEVVKQVPEAATVVAETGGKIKLMELISHENAEVRFEALRATQSLLAHIFA